MKIFNIRKIASAIVCLTIATTSMYAQGKMPSWVKKTPTPKDAYIGIATAIKPTPMDTIPFNPNYKEDTRRSALWKVANQLPWQIDQKASLCAILSMKGMYKASLNEVLFSEIQRSPLFSTYQEWETETEYWCYYSIKMTDAQQFVENLVSSTMATGERLYAEAKSLQQQVMLKEDIVPSAFPLICGRDSSMWIIGMTGYMSMNGMPRRILMFLRFMAGDSGLHVMWHINLPDGLSFICEAYIKSPAMPSLNYTVY